jgi:release factor glutamine methyltransferase
MRSGAASPSRPPRASDLLRAADGVDRLDAELLLAHVLGVDRAALHRDPGQPVADAARFAALVRRRRAGEPAAYLLGRKGFRRLELAVDARVLVPRPETEHLVEAAGSLPAGARVVDVGTGSGAVALALKDERPDLAVTGVDLSADALDVARANGTRLGLDVTWAQSDLLAGVTGPIDAVVANLPYVRDGDELPFEPALALRGGPDGLAVVRRLVGEAAARGVPFLALEIGQGQDAETAARCREAGWGDVAVVPDLAGIGRVVVARRP